MFVTHKLRLRGLAAVLASVALITATAHRAYAEEAGDDQVIEELVVTGDLRSLPGENVESVFGFEKSLLELPRSASTVSWEQMLETHCLLA